MASKITKFETLADMVDWVVENHYYAGKKWGLDDRSDRVYDDLEAGKSWDTAWSENDRILWDARYHNEDGKYSQEDIDLAEARAEELRQTRPSQHIETNYWLSEKTDRYNWHGKTIYLSEELGKLVASIWTMVPSYKGSSYTKYSPQGLSITGILKRLGRTDVADMIADAQARRKAEDEKNSRNASRRNVEKLAQQLIDEMKRGLDKGVIFPVHLSELVDMSNYLEE